MSDTVKHVALAAILILGIVAIQGRTPLELLAWALIVLIFGGAALVVWKLVSLMAGSGRPRP